ncbi:MAG: glycosyltransferase family 8 protein [Endomicrobiaceae bacterium]|nr:glycosyltransferase family 8 protein [Endomicrobiaceae bacterium]
MDIKICFASDDNYAVHMAVTITSILKNAEADDNLFFYVLDGGISHKNKDKISGLKKIKDFFIEYINCQKYRSQNFPLLLSHFSPAIYLRIRIADLLPNIDKIIYLDSDIIVCSSLKELFEEDTEDCFVSAVEDIGLYWAHKTFGRKKEKFYVNTGVMVLNLQLWREYSIGEQMYSFVGKTKEKLNFGDQDVINSLLKNKIKPLNLAWNVQSSFFEFYNVLHHPLKKEIKIAKKHPKIIHYITEKKPWNSYAPKSSLYFYYLAFSGFKSGLVLKDKIKIFGQAMIYKLTTSVYFIRFIISPFIRGYRTDDKKIKIRILHFMEFTLCKTK